MTNNPLTPPPTLRPEERTIWDSYLTEIMRLGLQTRTPPALLLDLVSVTYRHQRATALLSATDILVNRDGQPIPNPNIAIQERAAQRIETLRKQLHLHQPPLRPDTPIKPKGVWYCPEHKQWHGTCHKSDGTTCHGTVVEGLSVCKAHGGSTKAAMAKHLRAVEQRRNPLAGEPMDIGPAEALLWRVGVLAGEVKRLDERIAALEEQELVFGVMTETDDTDADGGTGRKTVRGARLSIWVQLRDQRERQLTAACEACHRAGVEQKLVDLFKEQAAMMRLVLFTTLGRLGYDEADDRMPVVLAEVIREVTGLKEITA